MADDASYNTFLSKANQDPNSGGSNEPQSTSQARSKFDPSETPSSAIPAALKDIQATYVSDTDSDFEPVFFSYSGSGAPSVEDFKLCLGVKGEEKVEELKVSEWDPRGEYKSVVERVESVGQGQGVKVFRVEVGRTRVEYYVLTVGERKLVGVRVKAVES